MYICNEQKEGQKDCKEMILYTEVQQLLKFKQGITIGKTQAQDQSNKDILNKVIN